MWISFFGIFPLHVSKNDNLKKKSEFLGKIELVEYLTH